MIGAMARHRVQVLRAGGKTLRRIASETGIPQREADRPGANDRAPGARAASRARVPAGMPALPARRPPQKSGPWAKRAI